MLCNCSSCDAEVSINETDNYGRCTDCQITYGDIDEEEYLEGEE